MSDNNCEGDRKAGSMEQTKLPPEKTEKQPKIYIFNRKRLLKEVQLTKKCTLGRESTGQHPDIDIPVPVVSRIHGEFYPIGGEWHYRDLYSSNGTWINGKQQEECIPKNGDLLKITQTYADENDQDNEVWILYSRFVPEHEKPKIENTCSQKEECLRIQIRERNVWSHLKKRTLLQNIQMDIQTGEMVLILGGSGVFHFAECCADEAYH